LLHFTHHSSSVFVLRQRHKVDTQGPLALTVALWLELTIGINHHTFYNR